MIVLGNWKLNPQTLGEAVDLAAETVRQTADDAQAVTVGVCVPFVWMDAVSERVRGSHVELGAQTVSPEPEGAFTGETSAPMLNEFECRYCLVGHSERRALFGETDADVAARVRALHANHMMPVVCVGETLAERDSGHAEEVVLASLAASTEGVTEPFVVAYEPVWAIGTGRTATPEQAQAMHALISSALAMRGESLATILYGGSVKPDNAAELFAQPDIGGALVGGASLDASAFAAIVAAARASY